jgi:DNA-binding transcriptional ArsR family regulator
MFNHMVEHTATRLDETFAVLAHRVRREMLVRLSRRDMRVTELAAYFAISLPAASKHIGRLERAGLVMRRVDRRDHWICLDAGPLQDAAAWFAPYQTFWTDR